VFLKIIPVGPIQANCIILGCDETQNGVVIDPGDDVPRILKIIEEAGLDLRYIVNTHGHFDHVGGNAALKAATEAPILIHPEDAPMLGQLTASARNFGLNAENSPDPDRLIEEGEIIEFGTLSLKVLHTPGHTPGGVSLAMDGKVFVGDTLFAGSIGRTDFPGGDYGTLIHSIQQKLFSLDDEVVVYTGHGPETTIGQEKRTNPFARLN
jgi:glyoxylase-like metal-dependent hydrolase (beta-lactamase superfamily II)